MIKKLILLLSSTTFGLVSSGAMAHTGFHAAGLFHPLTGIDHFLVILMLAVLAAVTSYYLYKK